MRRTNSSHLFLKLLILLFGMFTVGTAYSASSPSVTKLTLSSTSVPPQTAVTLTAMVLSGGKPVSPGLVLFCDAAAAHCTDIHILGQAQLTKNGTAAIKLRLGVGSLSIQAIFQGTQVAARSESPAQTLTVTGAIKTTTDIFVRAVDQVASQTFYGMVSAYGRFPASGQVTFGDASNGGTAFAEGTLQKKFVPVFKTVSKVPTGTTPYDVETADFNGDGIPDLVTANNISQDLNIMLGNGDGTFTVTRSPHVLYGLCCVAVADFNGDGIPDLAVASGGENDTDILLGNGDGTFTRKTTLRLAAASLEVGDFNGDGIPDLAMVNPGACCGVYQGTVSILIGNGDGTFQNSTSVSVGVDPSAVAVGDFNGDGILDLAVTNNRVSSQTSVAGTVMVLLGNGDGTFLQKSVAEVGIAPVSVATGDFNGDGILDLATADDGNYPATGTVTILKGKGDGTFTISSQPAVGRSPRSLRVADFNGDGLPDLALANAYDNSVIVLLGKTDGTFEKQYISQVGSYPTSIAVGDFNGDGATDLAVLYGPGEGDMVNVLLGSLATTAVANDVTVPGPGNHHVYAQYSGDALHTGSTSATWLVSNGKPVLYIFGGNGQTAVVGKRFAKPLEVLLKDAEGRPIAGATIYFSSDGLTFSSASAITLADGHASVYASPNIAGDLTATATTNGINEPATFSLAGFPAPSSETTLIASPDGTVAAGTVITLTASVSSAGRPVPAGLVLFCNAPAQRCADVNVLGEAQLTSSGKAIIKLRLGIGSHSIKAKFTGTDAIAPE